MIPVSGTPAPSDAAFVAYWVGTAVQHLAGCRVYLPDGSGTRAERMRIFRLREIKRYCSGVVSELEDLGLGRHVAVLKAVLDPASQAGIRSLILELRALCPDPRYRASDLDVSDIITIRSV